MAGGDPGGGSKPDSDSVFNNGNSADGAVDEMDEGADDDSAASITSRATGDSWLNADGDVAMALKRDTIVDGGKELKSCGVANNVLTMDTSAEGGNVLRVDAVHSVVNRAVTDGD